MKQTIIMAIAVLFAASCEKVNGDGPVVTEPRVVTAFTAVHYALQGTMYYSPSPVFSVEIKAQQNIIDVIETFVHNGELKIRLRDNTNIHSHQPIEVYVQSPDLTGLHLSGSGKIIARGPLSNTRMWLESSGSGDIELEALQTDELEARISGSGKLLVKSGESVTSRIKISGSGKADFTGIKSDTAYTETSGSGDISLWVEQFLDSQISGSGKVKYKGNPQVKVKISGSGKVEPLN